MHAETGYLRPTPDGAELVVAQPTGLVEVHAGAWDGEVLELRCLQVGRAPSAKDVRSVRRRFVLQGDTLVIDLWMAHAETPETHHLHAELSRD